MQLLASCQSLQRIVTHEMKMLLVTVDAPPVVIQSLLRSLLVLVAAARFPALSQLVQRPTQHSRR